MTFPARLHVLLARSAPTAVVIRRGPSKHVCTIGWDRRTDAFEIGQWLKGRIYEEESDLSPDGRHLIYGAMDGRWHSEVGGCWTAISRAPYLKAIGLWGKSNCLGSGGLFADDRGYWLLDPTGHRAIEVPEDLTPVDECLDLSDGLGVRHARLLRDGWHMASRDRKTTTYEKPLPGYAVLRKFHRRGPRRVGKGCNFDEHEVSVGSGTIDGRDWEWADFDTVQRRLMWAENGCLFEAQPTRASIERPRCIHDFNDMRFEAIKAPY